VNNSSARRTDTAPVAFRSGAVRPIAVADAHLEPGFWGARQELNDRAIIAHAAEWMTRLGWVRNFEDAASGSRYEHRGREFADSEIYKLIEAISWEIARGRDTHAALLNRLVDIVLAAQEPDGYLHTLFGRPWQRPRYSDFQWGHELYCFGHFLQAAVAHHRATGEERMLEGARALADHVCVLFGPGGLNRVCGHAEIELGLVELYRETGVRRYLDQASVFLERRGTGTIPLHEFGRAFWQDDMKVRDAEVLRGHAVRALYLSAGAADVAAETDDVELRSALERQWQRTVARRTYLTGGMGSHHMDEAFGDDFVLPPDRSYCETCAGVASVMFSWRLLLATGEAKYADLIERSLFNVVATSPSEDGRAFFYANTLHQRVEHSLPSLNEDGVVIRGGAAGRQAWFEVSCCPPNVARTLASLGAYVVTENDDAIQIQQFVAGVFQTSHATVRVATDYPLSGTVEIEVDAVTPGVSLEIRIPSWAEGARIRRAGDETAPPAGDYARLLGVGEGERITLVLPMQPRITRADDRVDAVRGCLAVERGPEVLALESVDLPEGWLLDEVALASDPAPAERDGSVWVDVVRLPQIDDAAWPYARPATDAAADRTGASVALVRYHEWAERGPSTMRVWIPVSGM
jgi:DUF1680 family protein